MAVVKYDRHANEIPTPTTVVVGGTSYAFVKQDDGTVTCTMEDADAVLLTQQNQYFEIVG